MSKSFRTFALAATLALATVPSLLAEPMGCNPRPPQGSNAVTVVVHAALALFGL